MAEIVDIQIKIVKINGDDTYEIVALREGYNIQVATKNLSTIQDEITKIVNFCKNLKTDEEKLKEQKEKLLEFVIKNSTDKQKIINPDFFDEWIIGKKMLENRYVNHLGIVYKCLKEHIADYQLSPSLYLYNKYWEKIEDEKPIADGVNPEWQEHYEKAEFYYDDLSYPAGVYKKHYNELYKSKEKVPAGKTPKDNPQFWKLIPKKLK